jgi:MOSC domain-containing protein YiiM
MKPMFELLHFYISPVHNFFGHHDLPPGDEMVRELEVIECVAGRGIAGDRFFDFKNDYKGQITFFAMETHERLCREFGRRLPPSVYRRNAITRGFDLNELIGCEFEIQGVTFEGTEEAKPCHWMNDAFGPGAENALQGVGGLRAKILDDGELRLSRLLETVPA